MVIAVRDLRESDRPWAVEALASQWGSPFIVSRGIGYHADELPGLVAECDGLRAGLLTYHLSPAGFEVMTIQAIEPRRGVGLALLRAATVLARELGAHRLWLVTTNDNEGAIAFYRAQGMRLAAVHAGAIAAARRLKPEIPLVGRNGSPIEDEIEFELALA